MYRVYPNFRTLDALVAALKQGEAVTVFQENALNNASTDRPKDGPLTVEGPRYPQRGEKKWKARVSVKGGLVRRVL